MSTEIIPSVVEGLQLWQYGPLVGILITAVITISYFLIKCDKRNAKLVDWIQQYSMRAVQSNTKNAILLERLVHNTNANDEKLASELFHQGERQIESIKLMSVELSAKIESLRN